MGEPNVHTIPLVIASGLSDDAVRNIYNGFQNAIPGLPKEVGQTQFYYKIVLPWPWFVTEDGELFKGPTVEDPLCPILLGPIQPTASEPSGPGIGPNPNTPPRPYSGDLKPVGRYRKTSWFYLFWDTVERRFVTQWEIDQAPIGFTEDPPGTNPDGSDFAPQDRVQSPIDYGPVGWRSPGR